MPLIVLILKKKYLNSYTKYIILLDKLISSAMLSDWSCCHRNLTLMSLQVYSN